jgi:hypothetical protein
MAISAKTRGFLKGSKKLLIRFLIFWDIGWFIESRELFEFVFTIVFPPPVLPGSGSQGRQKLLSSQPDHSPAPQELTKYGA